VKNKTFKVLDDGFVRVVDLMGDDSSIVQAARVSYGKGTKTVRDDRGLIRHLVRLSHTSPLEMCEIKLHVRVPMDCWRQWIRHRMVSVNERSSRYSVVDNAMSKTAPTKWRTQSKTNKQGSDDYVNIMEGIKLSEKEEFLQEYAYKIYQDRLDRGIAREQARKDLPLSTYTEAYWKIDLHNLLHFLKLRMDPAAQWEIRQYANIIGYEIVANWCPLTWEAFLDYKVNAVTFSSNELTLLQYIIQNRKCSWDILSKGEQREFIKKLKRLNIIGDQNENL